MLQQIIATKLCIPTFEFLVVGNSSRLFNVLTVAIHDVRGRLSCAASADAAMDYISRRKVDGIVIDMSIAGAIDLLARLQCSRSNGPLIVFACIGSPQEAKAAFQAGANFVLNKPLEAEAVTETLKSASHLMVAGERRFFRYPLMLPIELQLNGKTEQGIMSNLSEGGMAIWNLCPHEVSFAVDFSFVLPFGGHIQGHGEIAWTDENGIAGIRFHILPEDSYAHLFGWLGRRDRSMFHHLPV